MKKYFIFAAAALVALCNVSCSSDDSGFSDFTPPSEAVIPEPETAKNATAFTIPAASQPTATDGSTKLEQVDITESSKAVIKVDFNGDAKYLTFDTKYRKEGNKEIYDLFKNDQKKGTIESLVAVSAAPRRSLNLNNIKITLVVEIPNDNGTTTTVSFPETTVTDAQQTQEAASTTQTVNICRTWTIEQMSLSLKDLKKPGTSKVTDCTISTQGGNLKTLADEAQKNSAGLTDKEYKDLCKVIKGITLTKAGQLSIEYDNGLTDACTWAWGNTEQSVVTIKSEKGENFGNKFLNDDSRIGVTFFTSGIAQFYITTTIDSNNKCYDATVKFTLK